MSDPSVTDAQKEPVKVPPPAINDGESTVSEVCGEIGQEGKSDSTVAAQGNGNQQARGPHNPHGIAPTEKSEQEYFDRNTRLGCILFVGNLPFQTPWQHVKDRFQEAGKVRYTDLIADSEGRPKGSALVTMESPEGAQRGIELFNEQPFDGRRLIVRLLEVGRRPPLVQRERMPVYGRGRGPTGLSTAAPTDDCAAVDAGVFYPQQPQQFPGPNGLHHHYRGGMSPFGRQQRGGYHTGGHHNTYHRHAMHGGREAGIVPPKPRSHISASTDDESGRRLFVGNLPYDCTRAALHDTFQQVGTVVRAEVRTGRNGRSTGVGIVVMTTIEDARNAINEFDGIEMAGRAMKVGLDHSS